MGLGAMNPGCGCCGCPACNGGRLPANLQVAVSGVVVDNCAPSTACNGWNATFVLPPLGECDFQLNNLNGMTDKRVVSGIICDLGTASITALFYESGGSYFLDVTFRVDLGGTPAYEEHVFRYSFGTTKPDCQTLSGLSLTHISSTSYDLLACNFSGATVTVDSL